MMAKMAKTEKKASRVSNLTRAVKFIELALFSRKQRELVIYLAKRSESINNMATDPLDVTDEFAVEDAETGKLVLKLSSVISM